MNDIGAVRSCFRFSLRTLFVMVTVGCVWLAWTGYTTRMRESLQSRANEFKIAKSDGYHEFGKPEWYAFMSPYYRQHHPLGGMLPPNPDFDWDGEFDDVTISPFTSRGSVHVRRSYGRLSVHDEYVWERIDGEWFAKLARVPESCISKTADGYAVGEATPIQAARIIDVIFRQYLGIRPHTGEGDDYAVGTEW